MVAAFSCRKSTQKRRLPSFFLTITTGKAHGLIGGADDVTGQHLLDLRHLLPSNSRVLSPIGLAERGPVGFYRVPQQRSTPEIVFPLAEDVAKLLKEVI